MVNGKSFLKLDDIFSFAESRITRNKHDLTLKILRCKSNIGLNSFAVRTAKVWNDLPNDTVHSTSVAQFRKRLCALDLTKHLKCFPLHYE
jgi:hypothetical protein